MFINNLTINNLKRGDGHSITYVYDKKDTNPFDRMRGLVRILHQMDIKNIIHVGCCNHPDFVEKMVNEGNHLHVLLQKEFEKVIGFDINQEAYNKCIELGIKDIYLCDFLDEDRVKEIILKKFGDESYMILFPEVIEHIIDPVGYLRQVKEMHKNQSICLTLPNAYSYEEIRRLIVYNVEYINDDHKFAFTPSTSLKMLVMAGIKPTRIEFLSQRKIARLLKRPVMGGNIVLIGELNT